MLRRVDPRLALVAGVAMTAPSFACGSRSALIDDAPRVNEAPIDVPAPACPSDVTWAHGFLGFWGVDVGLGAGCSVLVLGNVASDSRGASVTRVESDGRLAWTTTFSDPKGWVQPTRLVVTPSDATAFGGAFYGKLDTLSAPHPLGFVMELDAGGAVRWSHAFGDLAPPSIDYTAVLGLTTDASGAIYITGKASGTVDFGGGPLTVSGLIDGFVAKYDADGRHVFSRLVGGEGVSLGWAITTDPTGGIVFAGQFQRTVDFDAGPPAPGGQQVLFLQKIDAAGEPIWTHSFSNTGGVYEVSHVAVDAVGDVYVAGGFTGAIELGAARYTSESVATFLMKLDPAGHVLWSRAEVNVNVDLAGLAVSPDGAARITGEYTEALDFDAKSLPTPSNLNAYIARISPDGGVLSTVGMGGSSYARGEGIAIDAAGHEIVVGTFDGPLDVSGVELTSTKPGGLFVARLPR
jgi:hypothetical protein